MSLIVHDRPAIQIHDLSKHYEGQAALRRVSLTVPSGKITALLGHNGSGKSTLIRILAGVTAPDETGGALAVRGTAVPLPLTEHKSRQLGLHFVHQDLALIDEMTISENVGLYTGFSRRRLSPLLEHKVNRDRTENALRMAGVRVDNEDKRVGELVPAARTLLAVARMLYRASEGGAPIVVLDEPTASLAQAEVSSLFDLLQHAVRDGATCIYVTHRLAEVAAISHHVVVLRDGATVLERPTDEVGHEQLVEAIIGGVEHTQPPSEPPFRHSPLSVASQLDAPSDLLQPEVTSTEQPLLELRSVRGRRLDHLSLAIYPREIVGVTGLLGCGKSELARAMAGEEQLLEGDMTFAGRNYRPRHPKDARRVGVGYVPQDRLREGIIPGLSIGENLTLPVLHQLTRGPWISARRQVADSVELIARMRIQPASHTTLVEKLSGGNQQKVVVGRYLRPNIRLLVSDELTQGIDVGTRAELFLLAAALAERGVAVVLVSSDYSDLAQAATRVLIMERGRIAAELKPPNISEPSIARAVFAASSTAHSLVT